MKRISLLFLFFCFFSCQTDFDVNSDWKEITIVYGLLDQNQDVQYIKINKAFLGEGDALQMASISDSLNYDTLDLEVKINKRKNGNIVDSIFLSPTILEKDDGIFSTENNIIYATNISEASEFESGYYYDLEINNNKTGKIVTASTGLISGFKFKSSDIMGPYNFYDPTPAPGASNYRFKQIRWEHASNGKVYQLDLIFNYLENGVSKSLTWRQPIQIYDQSDDMELLIEGQSFFNFIKNNISSQNNVERVFSNLRVVMTIGTTELDTYMSVNMPLSGIIQQRPQYTNIDNGIGLFTSRNIYVVENTISLDRCTLDQLVELDRNFVLSQIQQGLMCSQ